MEITAFTKHNPKYKDLNHPEEDSFKYSINEGGRVIVAVADGITRDRIVGSYPNPSPAKKAADLFCNSFLAYIRNRTLKDSSIKDAFRYGNRNIWRQLNNDRKVDYLENDFAGCVASGGVIENGKLHWGFITDCGVCVFDKYGKLKFRTPDEGPNSKGDIKEEVEKKYNTSFKEAKGRKITRSEYRNNVNNPLAYGALTGEDSGMNYVRTGEIGLEKEDRVIFYSDGFLSLIYSDEFSEKISGDCLGIERLIESNLERIDGSEGTLVSVVLE